MHGITTAYLYTHTTIRHGEGTVIKFSRSTKTEPIINSKQCSNIYLELRDNLVVLWAIYVALVSKVPAIFATAVLFIAG